MSVVLKRTLGDSDRRFGNLSVSHLQSESDTEDDFRTVRFRATFTWTITWENRIVKYNVSIHGNSMSNDFLINFLNIKRSPEILFFFGLFRNCLNCDSLRWPHTHFICIPAIHIISFCVSFLSRVDELNKLAGLLCMGLHNSGW